MNKIWTCKIGEVDTALLPDGSDAPMRHAARVAYVELTGREPDFCFSGWGGALTEPERAAHENREPSEEYRLAWCLQQAAPDMQAALRAMVNEQIEYARLNNLGDATKNHNVRLALAALAKSEGKQP